ncbi:MAG: YtxH domain-containing protein [Actinobacteria bacterium]|nr:YtxH domain-containing protein [Actinomycetota bacterium]
MCNSGSSGTIKGVFIGFTLGFVVGAVTALFLTTKTGEELRADIKRIAKDIGSKVEEKASKIKNITREKYNEIVNSVVLSYKKIKDLTEKEIEFIKKVIAEQKDVTK